MNRINEVLLLLALFVGLTSCREIDEKESDRITLANDANRELHFSGDGGSRSIVMKATTIWSAVSDQDWCIVNPPEGTPSDLRLTITADSSRSDEPRTATVTVTAGEATMLITVVQDERSTLSVDDADHLIASTGGTFEVEVQHNVEYDVWIPTEATWIREIESKTVTESVLVFEVDANESMDNRSTVVVLVGGESDLEKTIEVVQLRKEALVASDTHYLVDATAGTLSFGVTSSDPLEVEVEDASWLTLVRSKAVETELEFAFEDNPMPVVRTARIRLSSGSATDYVEVEQRKGPEKFVFSVVHLNENFDMPYFGGKFTGTVFWGDGTSEDFVRAYGHDYGSSLERTVTFELNGEADDLEFYFENIVGITGIDLSGLPFD